MTSDLILHLIDTRLDEMSEGRDLTRADVEQALNELEGDTRETMLAVLEEMNLTQEEYIESLRGDIYDDDEPPKPVVKSKEPRPKRTNEELVALFQQGDQEAIVDLYNNNQGLLKKCTDKLRVGYSRFGHDLEDRDLLQYAAMGLLKAANKFDTKLGNKFSTLAMYYINESLYDNVNKHGYSVKLNPDVVRNVFKLRKLAAELESAGVDVEAHPEKLAEKLGVSEEKLEEYRFIEMSFMMRYSLNESMSTEDDEAGQQQDMVADASVDILDQVVKQDFRDIIDSQLAELDEQQAEVIRRRYGWTTHGEVQEQKDIAQDMGLTVDKVRNLEEAALKKLRHPSRSSMTMDYISLEW